jgi:hypothetical protein
MNFDLLGYPDAAKLARVPDDFGKRLAHCRLHEVDLLFARECLEQFDHERGEDHDGPTKTVCMALWHSALNSTFKCFGWSRARQGLDPAKIYGEGSDRDDFDCLKSLRDKNITHDDSDWSQAIPCIVVAKPGIEPRVQDALCIVVRTDSAGDGLIASLRLIIEKALNYVEQELDDQTASILDMMQTWDYRNLTALPGVRGNMPTTKSIAVTRDTPGR